MWWNEKTLDTMAWSIMVSLAILLVGIMGLSAAYSLYTLNVRVTAIEKSLEKIETVQQMDGFAHDSITRMEQSQNDINDKLMERIGRLEDEISTLR
jgi:hypothetical protein